MYMYYVYVYMYIYVLRVRVYVHTCIICYIYMCVREGHTLYVYITYNTCTYIFNVHMYIVYYMYM